MITGRRPVQAQDRPSLGMERGGEQEIRPPAEELLTTGSYWETKNPFSLRVYPLVN